MRAPSDQETWYAVLPDGLRLSLRVQPRAGREGLGPVALDADGKRALKVQVAAAPEDGKANKAVIALLAKAFKRPKRDFTLLMGETDRRKVVHLAGDPALLRLEMEEWTQRHE